MIVFRKLIILICVFFLLISSSYSKIQLKIVVKVDNEIITSHDIEKEINYLKALNPKLGNIDEDKLLLIAKKSTIKEVIKKKRNSKI